MLERPRGHRGPRRSPGLRNLGGAVWVSPGRERRAAIHSAIRLVANGRPCKHAFVSISALNQALEARSAEGALQAAHALRYVPLRHALRLTLLLADERHPRYEAAARRFLARVLEERNPPLMEAKRLADAFAHIRHHYYGHFARLALQGVVEQLHRIELEPLTIEFEGPMDQSGGKRRAARFEEDLPPARPEKIADVLDPGGVVG